MPQSKKEKYRQQKLHQQHSPRVVHSKKTTGAVGVVVFLFILIGFGIAYFAAGANFLWLALGAVIGAAAGYFFAQQIVKSLSK